MLIVLCFTALCVSYYTLAKTYKADLGNYLGATTSEQRPMVSKVKAAPGLVTSVCFCFCLVSSFLTVVLQLQ